MTSFPHRLKSDDRGSPAVEFVLVLPVALLMMLGLGDLAYQAYLESVLTGAVQKAGRDATIQGKAAETSAIDQMVMDAVKVVSSRATFVSSRKNYDNYTAVAAEPFTDTNHNGVHDAGECYSDVNGNNVWDADPGSSGEGGASDVSVYKMTATFPRLFPTWLVGWSSTASITASTYLKNQPYATQNVVTVTTKCN
ncbi:MAG: pilus assembly protein [Sphingomonas sp.]|nr:pilus assembly protein [Sphingomonas sp.]